MAGSELTYQSPRYWDGQAPSFDDEPDHGLRDPAVRASWRDQLVEWFPPPAATILDIGCGTGSLSLLMAELGHQVIGADWSAEMIARAIVKASTVGLPARFFVMDAAAPALAPGWFDVVLCRHLLWALPDPARVLRRWARLLVPGGRLVLIEGYWHTGGGLHVAEVEQFLPPSFTEFETVNLSRHPALWGGEVEDERFVVIARMEAPHRAEAERQ